MNTGIIILVIVIFIILLIISIYNSLVTLRQRVRNAWGQIDVQLQKRFDLIPNIVNTVKGYMSHEKGILEKVTELRSSWASATTISEKAELGNELNSSLKTIMAISENYPDLKANTNFSELNATLKETEEKIAYSRQFYNDAVTIYNTKIETIPNNIIAGLFKFLPETLFTAESDEARKNVKVDFEN